MIYRISFLIFILSFTLFNTVNAQYVELVEIVSVDMCECVSMISPEITEEEMTIEFEVCIIEYFENNADLLAMYAENNDMDFTIDDLGEEFGEMLGLNLVSTCPSFMELIMASVKNDGENAYALLLEGNEMIDTGGCQRAIPIYEQILDIDTAPDSTVFTAYNNLGFCKNEIGDYYGAISNLNSAINMTSNNVLPYAHRGNAKFELTDYEGAIEDYTTYLTYDSTDARVLNRRGLSYYYSYNPEAAYADYYRALSIDTLFAEVHFNLGLLNNYVESYPDAVDNFLMVYDLKPEIIDLSYYLSQSYMGLDEFQKAIDVLESDSLTYSDEYNLTEIGYSYYQLQDYGSAINAFDQAISINNQYFRPILFRAYANQDSGLHEIAIPDFDTAYQLAPDVSEISFYQGFSHFELGNFETALDLFSRTITIEEDYAEAYDYRARTKLELDDVEGAIEDYSTSIRLYPSDEQIYKERGESYLKVDRIDDACTDFLLAKQFGHEEVQILIDENCQN